MLARQALYHPQPPSSSRIKSTVVGARKSLSHTCSELSEKLKLFKIPSGQDDDSKQQPKMNLNLRNNLRDAPSRPGLGCLPSST